MTKQKKRKFPVFPLCMLIYGIVFLLAALIGLKYFWNYIEAYEVSRPHIATDAYMEQLTVDYICQKSDSLLEEIDPTIQTREEGLQVMKNALKEPFTCSKWVNQSTDKKLVYVLRSGAQIIGTFEMEPVKEGSYGFHPWTVTGDSFDLSFLLKPGFEVTAPHDAQVFVGGKLLGSENIAEKDIPYEELSDLYDTHSLPTRIRYSVGTHLGDLPVHAISAQGSPIDLDANPAVFLNNCTGAEKKALEEITGQYIDAYVRFTCKTDDALQANFDHLRKFMVSGGQLEQRMRKSFGGLEWVKDRQASIQSLDIHHLVSIGEGRYICDVTCNYKSLNDKGDIVPGKLNMKITFLETANGLRAEAMLIY